MDIIKWSDDFKIGNEEIDKEHWGLFALINDLGDKRAQGNSVSSVTATFKALVAYVDIHFQNEERLMKETGYPGFESHRNIHNALNRRVGEFRADFMEDPKTFDYEALREFLSNWLKQHILETDMEFAAFLKTHSDQG